MVGLAKGRWGNQQCKRQTIWALCPLCMNKYALDNLPLKNEENKDTWLLLLRTQLKKGCEGDGEMAQWFGVPAALSGTWVRFPEPASQRTATRNSYFRGFMPSSGLNGLCKHAVHWHTGSKTSIHIKINLI